METADWLWWPLWQFRVNHRLHLILLHNDRILNTSKTAVSQLLIECLHLSLQTSFLSESVTHDFPIYLDPFFYFRFYIFLLFFIDYSSNQFSVVAVRSKVHLGFSFFPLCSFLAAVAYFEGDFFRVFCTIYCSHQLDGTTFGCIFGV